MAGADSGAVFLRRSAAGFTLLELVLVMVIIGTVLGMSALSLRGFFASRQSTDAAAQIVALAEYARSCAIARGCVFRLNLDASEGKYWIEMQQEGAFVTLPTEFGRVFRLPQGTRATWLEGDAAQRGWIRFYPDGRAERIRIRLTGRQGEVVDVFCPSPAERFRVVSGVGGDGTG